MPPKKGARIALFAVKKGIQYIVVFFQKIGKKPLYIVVCLRHIYWSLFIGFTYMFARLLFLLSVLLSVVIARARGYCQKGREGAKIIM